jgi:hypothetical protein
VELRPVSLGDKGRECVVDFLVNHCKKPVGASLCHYTCKRAVLNVVFAGHDFTIKPRLAPGRV